MWVGGLGAAEATAATVLGGAEGSTTGASIGTPGKSAGGGDATAIGAGVEGVGGGGSRRSQTRPAIASVMPKAAASPIRKTKRPTARTREVLAGGGVTRVGGVTALRSTRSSSTVGGPIPVGTEVDADRSPASSADTKAVAVGHRSSGCLARALSKARTSGSGTCPAAGSGIGSWTCFIMIPTGVSAEKGTWPTNSS